MKRLLSVLTLCALMLALTACGNGNGASSGGASSGAASAGGEISFDAVYQGILDAQENAALNTGSTYSSKAVRELLVGMRTDYLATIAA